MPIGFTYGASHTQTAWPDVRQVSWDELASLLTIHQPGAKEGPCIVPAVFTGSERKKEQATQIDAAFLDSDTGVPLDEIVRAIKRRGWEAVVSSTHSHMTRRTEAAGKNWDRYFAKNPGSDPEDFLREEKGYRPEVAKGATTAETKDGMVIIDHWPCPKFRVALPLAKPWRASDYQSQAEANAAWKAAVEALAAALDLPHDQACTDTSRLFFLPRTPKRGAPPEIEILHGTRCDIFALVPPEQPKQPSLLNGHANGHHPPSRYEFADPITGEFVDLTAWAKHYGRTFLIAKALRKHHPESITGLVVDNAKVHVDCPNSDQHTHPGRDNATFVVNAGGNQTEGFVFHCRHAHCTGRDRLFFVQRMLEERWITIEGLTEPGLHIQPPGNDPGYRDSDDRTWRDSPGTCPDDLSSDGHFPPLLDTPAFMATFTNPDYLIDGIIQRARVHALTSMTGHGKTAAALYFACSIATGRSIGSMEVVQGGVVFLAGENPDDLCGRVHAACQFYQINPAELPIRFMPGNFPLSPQAAENLRQKIDEGGYDTALIIGDSAAAFFPGDDENANVQMGEFARSLRSMTKCRGNPAILVLSHPIKNPGKENLLPRGGSAFLNEIDANLTLWSDAQGEVSTLHWQGKIRGADFQPLTLSLKPVKLEQLRDAKGRSFMSVVATLQTDDQADKAIKQALTDENTVLEHLRRSPGISIAGIAVVVGWVNANGEPNKARVQRLLHALRANKLAKPWRGKWRITDAGKDELEG